MEHSSQIPTAPAESEIQPILTPRLCLKSIGDEDGEDFIRMFLNPEIAKTYMIPVFVCREDALRLFRVFRDLSRKTRRFVRGVFLEGRCIGFLNDVHTENGTIEMGYVIHPDYKNRGYATEAFHAAIAELFRRGYTAVRAGAFDHNGASIRVMEKSGMHPVGLEEDIEYRGEVHRCIYYEISNTDIKER